MDANVSEGEGWDSCIEHALLGLFKGASARIYVHTVGATSRFSRLTYLRR